MLDAMKYFIAVETSDIVGSTKLKEEQLKLVMQNLQNRLSNKSAGTSTFVEFYRGDAYQLTHKNAKHSLRYAFLTKLFLLSQFDQPIKINQSLALGSIDIDDDLFITGKLHSRMDPVFIESGRQLDGLSKGALVVHPKYFDSCFSLTTQFFNRIVGNLSSKQALVLFTYIQDGYPEQKKIAEQLNMTRQNVNTHLIRANADLIKAYIDYFEEKCGEPLQ